MIRRADVMDVARIWPKVREQERITAERLSRTPESVLFRAICQDLAFAAEINRELVCLWGIHFDHAIGMLPKVWLVTSDLVERHYITFLREGLRFIAWAQSEYGQLEGMVDIDNEVSRRWLEWLGFRPVEDQGQYIRMRTGGD